MKLDRISYQRVFAIGNYVTERIGLEASLDPNDNPQTELEHLKEIVNQLHAETLTQIDLYRGSSVRDISPVDQTIQGIIEDIGNCTVIAETNSIGVQVGLLAYAEMAEKYPEIKAAYDLKMLQLTKK